MESLAHDNDADRENVSHLANEKHKPSRKQQELMMYKLTQAQRVREEKERLKKEREFKNQKSLERFKMARQKSEEKSEARRLAEKHRVNATMASKEVENADRKWKLEQERLFRVEKKAKEKKEKERELEFRAHELEREREMQAAKKQKLLQERKELEQHVADEIEHKRMLKELERQEKMDSALWKKHEREELQYKLMKEQQEATQLAQESRALDEAAYHDVQHYLREEKEKRRKSLAFRLQDASEYRKKQATKANVDKVMERRDRQLELDAYNDMKRYLADEKQRRRVSLANFLEQESMYRKLKQAEADQQKEIDAASRALDEAAYRDTQEYLKSQKEQRRLSLAMRLELKSRQDIEDMKKQQAEQLNQERSRRLDRLAEEDVERYLEEEKFRERQIAYDQTKAEMHAAMKLQDDMEERLQRLEDAKKKDIEEYKEKLKETYGIDVDKREEPASEIVIDYELMENDVIEEGDEGEEEEDEGEVEEKEENETTEVEEKIAEEEEALPPPPTLPPTIEIPQYAPPPPANKRPSKLACCIIS